MWQKALFCIFDIQHIEFGFVKERKKINPEKLTREKKLNFSLKKKKKYFFNQYNYLPKGLKQQGLTAWEQDCNRDLAYQIL